MACSSAQTHPLWTAGLHCLREVSLTGCRNIVNRPGEALPLLPRLTALTSLSLRNCDGLQDGALHCTALSSLHHLDLSGEKLEVTVSIRFVTMVTVAFRILTIVMADLGIALWCYLHDGH